MANDELNFANDARGAVDYSARSSTWLVLLVVGLALVLASVWAAWAKVQQVSSGEGKVIPSRQVQVVESLEPGIVAQIMVSEGDLVEEGQGLVRIDDTGSSSRQGELHRREAALTAELHRLSAHAAEAVTYDIPIDADETIRPFYRDQRAQFLANRRRLDEQAAIRQKQLDQKMQGLAEAEATAESKKSLLALADRELKLIKRLFQRKAVPEIDYIRVQRQSISLRGDLKIWVATKGRLNAEIEEAKVLLRAEESQFLAEVSSRISTVNSELAVVQQTLRAATDRVRRAVLRAPVTGVINKLNVAAINEVVKAGTSVAEIVPVDGNLLVEVKVRPEDIAFISPGLKATIRITAYDYTRFGTLMGTVERIGADTITDQEGRTFYQVVVSRDAPLEGEASDALQIIPGMIATVDITTGDRTVLEYLLKPIVVLKDRALRDPR